MQIIEPAWITTEANRVGSHNSSWDILKRDHNVYASLLHAITTLNTCRSECIGYAVSASSTDRFPGESVVNTLTTRDRYLGRPSYWSSKGHADPDASETLIYKLKADLCVISEISVQPFEGDCFSFIPFSDISPRSLRCPSIIIYFDISFKVFP